MKLKKDSIDFKHWLTLTISHEYFENGKCTVFNLVPLTSTQKILKNYNIHIRKLENQYLAYVGVKSLKAVQEELPTSDNLFFQLLNTDKYFNSYTDILSDTAKGTLLFLTNPDQNDSSSEGASVLPTMNLPVQSLKFQVETSTDSEDRVVVKNREGIELFNRVAIEKQSSLSVDIERFGSGVYELWINKKRAKTFLGTSESLEEDCYGILQLQMIPIIESLTKHSVPELTAHFTARKAYLQYAIVVPTDKKVVIHDMQIEGKDNTLYSGPEEKSIGAEKANVFTSPDTIKLSQNIRGSPPLLKMKYSNEFSASILELEVKMPNPKISAVFPQKATHTFCAQTIIYV